MKSEPISIRVNDTLVNTLKEEARRLSYESNKDILYTDLIRDAVQDFASRVEKEAMMSDSDYTYKEKISDSDYEALDQNAPLSNRSKITAQLSSVLSFLTSDDEWLSMFGFIRNSLSISIQNQVKPIFESASLPRVILEKDTTYKPGRSYERDVCGIVYLISRRGAIPDVIQEGESYLIPTFEIACNPGISISKILDKDVQNLVNISLQSATSMAEEETANFCALIEFAGMNGKPIRVESLTLDALSRGYDLLVTNGQTPKHLIISPVTFTTLSREAASKKGNWKFESLQIDNQPVGHYQGAVIRVTDRIYDSEFESAYFVADRAGYFVEKQSLSTLIHSNPLKLRGSIVMWTEIGMSITDCMLTCVTTKTTES